MQRNQEESTIQNYKYVCENIKMELEEENNYCETIKHFFNFTILLKAP